MAGHQILNIGGSMEERKYRDWSESRVTTERDGAAEALDRMIYEGQKKRTSWDPKKPEQAVLAGVEVPRGEEPARVRRRKETRRRRSNPDHQTGNLGF
jgi:hypothetical protein